MLLVFDIYKQASKYEKLDKLTWLYIFLEGDNF